MWLESLGLSSLALTLACACGWLSFCGWKLRDAESHLTTSSSSGVCGSNNILCSFSCPQLLLVSVQRLVTQRKHHSSFSLAARTLPRNQTLLLLILGCFHTTWRVFKNCTVYFANYECRGYHSCVESLVKSAPTQQQDLPSALCCLWGVRHVVLCGNACPLQEK